LPCQNLVLSSRVPSSTNPSRPLFAFAFASFNIEAAPDAPYVYRINESGNAAPKDGFVPIFYSSRDYPDPIVKPKVDISAFDLILLFILQPCNIIV